MAGYNNLIPSGVVVPDTASLLTDVQNEFKNALGASLNTDASSPQGVLINAETLARTAIMKNNADLANQINPDLARGVFLDALCALTGLDRGSNAPTVLSNVYLVGTSGTVIPQGSKFQTPEGYVFTTDGAVTIPAAGYIAATATSDLTGILPVNLPLPGAAAVACILISSVSGLTAVQLRSASGADPATTSASASPMLTDDQLRTLRDTVLFKQGRSSVGNMYATVLAVPGVQGVSIRQNTTNAAATEQSPIDGIVFNSGHAVYACVDYPDTSTNLDLPVATALYNSNCGATFDLGGNGDGGVSKTITVLDPYNKQPYVVKFRKPIFTAATCSITVSQGTNVADLTTAIPQAVLNYAAGLVPNESGLPVGGNLSAFDIGAAVNQQLPGIFVRDCKVGSGGGATDQTLILARPWQKFTFVSNAINVTVV